MFFTNKASPTKNKSNIFVYSSFTKAEGTPLQSQYDFQLKFDLPNTTKKLKIVIEKQQDDISNALSDTSVANDKVISKKSTASLTKETGYTAGVNYLLSKSKYFVSFIRFGIRIDMPINPSVKVDLQKILKTEFMNIGLTQKFIEYRQEGFQEISQLSFIKIFSKTLQIDQTNSLVWTDETDVFALRNSLVLSQDLGDERSLSYSVGANAKLSPSFYYESYDTSINYRQLLYNDWLYGTLSVGASFPKTNHFNDEKFVQFRIDLFFRE